MHKRGGFRPGAGRPAREPGHKRLALSTTISHSSMAALRAFADASGKKLGEALDELIALATRPDALVIEPLPISEVEPEAP